FVYSSSTRPPSSMLFPYTTLFRSPLMSILPLPAVMRMRATEVLRRPVAMNSCGCAIKKLSKQNRGWFLRGVRMRIAAVNFQLSRSEEHTSELQSPDQLVSRLLLDQ